jgi:hypothetical protein
VFEGHPHGNEGKNREKAVQHHGTSDPVTGDIGQGIFERLVHVVGHASDGVIRTANPAVQEDAASGASDDERMSALAADQVGQVHFKSICGRARIRFDGKV